MRLLLKSLPWLPIPQMIKTGVLFWVSKACRSGPLSLEATSRISMFCHFQVFPATSRCSLCAVFPICNIFIEK